MNLDLLAQSQSAASSFPSPWQPGVGKEKLPPLWRAQGGKATLELGGIQRVATISQTGGFARCLRMSSGTHDLETGSRKTAHS